MNFFKSVKIYTFFIAFLCGVSVSSCEDTNVFILTEAGIDAVNAVTLSDEDVREIAGQASKEADRKNRVAPPGSPYDIRLRKLVEKHENHEGASFNFKVYMTKQVNAFAMADGSIRIYSGLMDLMSDEELVFVVGHEMGHVLEEHSRKKVVLAYGSRAIRKGLASQENEIGEIARSVIGSFAEQLANSQFSQHEERQADDNGARFLLDKGYTREPAISALLKFEKLAQKHTFLSSHPDPANRAERLRSGELGAEGDKEDSLLSRLWNFLVGLIKWFIALVLSWIQ